MQTLWAGRFARRMSTMRGSAIRELLRMSDDPDLISFAGGLAAPDAFPIDRFQEMCHRVLATRGRHALQYGSTEGYRPLREAVAERMRRYAVDVAPEEVLITSGAQQALDLIGRVFIDPGDCILTERPTYLGALQAWSAYQAAFVGVPTDEDGMRVAEAEPAIRVGPTFLYVLPNFQNPTGATLSADRREALVRLAARFSIPIVEDDPYGQLRYEGDHLTPLVTLDARLRGTRRLAGNVIYLGSLSKTLAPGLRLGWVAAPREVLQRLIQAKEGADLHTSTFAQMLAHAVMQEGFLEAHVRRLRATYRARRDAMLAAMAAHFPPDVTWRSPEGGVFLWVTLPAWMDADAVLHDALAEKVAFVPGAAFFPDAPHANHLRLNFSGPAPDAIEEGIRRLGGVLTRLMMARARAPVGHS